MASMQKKGLSSIVGKRQTFSLPHSSDVDQLLTMAQAWWSDTESDEFIIAGEELDEAVQALDVKDRIGAAMA